MIRISANYVFTLTGKPLKYGIIELNEQGVIQNIIDTGGIMTETRNLLYYSGILVPGFINTHCHLELSHLRGAIEKGGGLPNFVGKIVDNRNTFSDEKQIKAAQTADAMMYASGISAVADICNTSLSFGVKEKSKLHYHNLVEVFGIVELFAEHNFNKAKIVYDDAAEYISNRKPSDKATVVPHAPYSTSVSLLKKCFEFSETSGQCSSIHNQETESEDEFFRTKTGALYEALSARGVPFDSFEPTGKSSLQSMLPLLPEKSATLLVHNTFTTAEDVVAVNNSGKNVYFTLCPNANWYIENRLPNLNQLLKYTNKFTIGTDSYASNASLSVLEEMKTLQHNFPEINFETLLEFACKNGAEALGIAKQFGTFEIGKSPGVVLIENFDLQNFRLKPESTSRRMV